MNFTKYLPEKLCRWIDMYSKEASDITLFSGKNAVVSLAGQNKESSCFLSKEEFDNVVAKICKGSLYANQESMKQGYITDDGCRIGVCGTSVYDGGKMMYMRDITALNIRVARDIKGVSDGVINYIFDGETVKNTLIVAPPSCGKTTMLRDIGRNLGEYLRVGIVDEREEIVINNDIGKFTFFVKKCSKYDGVLNLLRSMSPQVIVTDEIGTREDEEAVQKLINAGCKIICTAHGYDERDVMRKPAIKKLTDENIFELIIVLSSKNGVGTVEKIICRDEDIC